MQFQKFHHRNTDGEKFLHSSPAPWKQIFLRLDMFPLKNLEHLRSTQRGSSKGHNCPSDRGALPAWKSPWGQPHERWGQPCGRVRLMVSRSPMTTTYFLCKNCKLSRLKEIVSHRKRKGTRVAQQRGGITVMQHPIGG